MAGSCGSDRRDDRDLGVIEVLVLVDRRLVDVNRVSVPRTELERRQEHLCRRFTLAYGDWFPDSGFCHVAAAERKDVCALAAVRLLPSRRLERGGGNCFGFAAYWVVGVEGRGQGGLCLSGRTLHVRQGCGSGQALYS